MTDDVIPAAGHDLGIPGAVAPPTPPPAFSMQEAASRKEAFLQDKTKTTALLNGDVGATNEWRLINDHLWQQPQFTQPRDEVTEHLQASSGYQLSDEVLAEFRENRPVSPAEYKLAQQRLDSRKNDPTWLAKYMRGDHEAKKEVALINSILSRPIRTPEPQGGNDSAQS
jgi:hypothetical protein